MSILIKTYSYKFGKEIINVKDELIEEIHKVILQSTSSLSNLTRPDLNDRLEMYFRSQNWSSVLKENYDFDIEFYKKNTGLKIRTGHPKFMGADLLEFESAIMNKSTEVDSNVYIVVTSEFRKTMINKYSMKWAGSLTFEKAIEILEKYSLCIHSPILLIGIDFA